MVTLSLVMTGWGGIVQNLFLQADLLDHLFNEGDLEVDAHAPHGGKRAHALDDVGLGLLNHLNIADDQHQQQNNDDKNNSKFHKSLLSLHNPSQGVLMIASWTMYNGQWTMDNGQWTMDNGQ